MAKKKKLDPFSVSLSELETRDLVNWLSDEIHGAYDARNSVIAPGGDLDYYWWLYGQGRRAPGAEPWPDAADLGSYLVTEKVDALTARACKTSFVDPVWTVEGWGEPASRAPLVEEFHQWKLEEERLQQILGRALLQAHVEGTGVLEVYERGERRVQMRNAWFAPAHPRRSLTGWGNFAHSTRAALTLLQAHALSGEQRYAEWAWLTPNVQLGLNPQGLCYVTGLGARSPRHPLSKLSQYSGAELPLPGLPVNGPHARLPGAWATTRLVTAAYWPAPLEDGQASDGGDGYPVLRRYTDSDQLPPMSEPTVAEIARVGIAFGLLRNASAPTSPARQQ